MTMAVIEAILLTLAVLLSVVFGLLLLYGLWLIAYAVALITNTGIFGAVATMYALLVMMPSQKRR